jgi:DNA-binding SARP family transcriptional activator
VLGTRASVTASQVRQRVTLLGGFRLYVGDHAVQLAPSPQRLVALLALMTQPSAAATSRGAVGRLD